MFSSFTSSRTKKNSMNQLDVEVNSVSSEQQSVMSPKSPSRRSSSNSIGEYLDDGNSLVQGRRSRRMRPLEANKEMIILMPEDDPVEVLGLEKNEMPEFQNCMEEQYEWVPEDEKGGVDAHNSDRHSDAQSSAPKSSALSLLGLSGGFNFNAGSGSGYGGTAVVIVGEKTKEEPKDIVTPGIALVAPVVAGQGVKNEGDQDENESRRGRNGGTSTSFSSSSLGSLSPVNGTDNNYESQSYSQYDPDSEDDAFLKALASAGASESSAKMSSSDISGSCSKMRTSIRKSLSTSHSREMAASMTLSTLSDMIMVLERELELSRKYEVHRKDLQEAATLSENLITRCDPVVEFAKDLQQLQHSEGSNADAQTVLSGATRMKSKLNNDRDSSPKSSNSDGSLNKVPVSSQSSRNNDDSNELPSITASEVRSLVSSHRACRLLLRVYQHHIKLVASSSSSSEGGMGIFLSKISRDRRPADSSSSSSSSSSVTDFSIDEKELEQSRALMLLIYEYWVIKRAGRKSSLLRCYHTYIMENWKTQDVLPRLPEDTNADAMLKGHDYLLRIRRDLDRARLIMDRVRRREKVKRDLIKTAGDAMEQFLSDTPIIEDSSESNKYSKIAALKTTISLSANNRQPRAAKKAAIAKIENPSSASNLTHSGMAHLFDYAEVTKAPFSLEEVDYSKVSAIWNENNNDISALDLDEGAAKDQYYSDYNPRGSSSSSTATNGGNSRSPASSSTHFHGSPTSSSSGWTADEDRLLLMGVAACGVGRWTEIREDFLLARNSAQMNQRFTRLARRRCDLVKLNSKTKKKRAESDDDNVVEYSDVRTAYMSPQDVALARSKLPPLIQGMLEDYNEDSIWEGIALRHLLDMQSKDKRCGRPQKYPLPIPIPKHLQNGGHLSKKRAPILRPSEMGFNWKGSGHSDGGSYNQTFYNSASRSNTGNSGNGAPPGNTKATSPSGKRRGRPPKKDISQGKKLAQSQNRGNSSSGKKYKGTADHIDDIDEDSIGSWTDEIENAQMEKVREQSAMREERIKARDKLTAAVAQAALSSFVPFSSESTTERDKGAKKRPKSVTSADSTVASKRRR